MAEPFRTIPQFSASPPVFDIERPATLGAVVLRPRPPEKSRAGLFERPARDRTFPPTRCRFRRAHPMKEADRLDEVRAVLRNEQATVEQLTSASALLEVDKAALERDLAAAPSRLEAILAQDDAPAATITRHVGEEEARRASLCTAARCLRKYAARLNSDRPRAVPPTHRRRSLQRTLQPWPRASASRDGERRSRRSALWRSLCTMRGSRLRP